MPADLRNRTTRPDQDALLNRVVIGTLSLSTAYAMLLSRLERRYPIKPDHIWAEVAGGVVVSLLPLALEARRSPELSWQKYEQTLWMSFFASGAPIILWQLGEAILRQHELLHYMGHRAFAVAEDHADNSTSLAL